jgi:multidrug resistance efflux pump
MFESRYRRFVPGVFAMSGKDVELEGDSGCVVLSAKDFELAKLFDGQRDAEAVRKVARERLDVQLDSDELEGFAAELGSTGLLHPGSHEPLPVPAQTDQEARALGWFGGGRDMRLPGETLAMPTSTIPGSRNSPGFIGSLAGGPRRIDFAMPPGPFLALGRLLIAPVSSGRALAIFIALIVSAVVAVITHRYAWAFLATHLFHGWLILPTLAASMALVNLFGSCARAAAIARYTPERPRLGLVFRMYFLPQLHVESAGAAERVDRVDRLRIVGAGLVGVATLLLIAILGWFLMALTQINIARYCVALSIACSIALLLRLNPLAFGEGYFLLANGLNQLDLRRQAVMALFGAKRPWQQQARPISRTVLWAYAVSVIAFWALAVILLFIFLGDWLADRFGGLGFLFFVGVLGTIMQKQYIRSGGGRSSLGVPEKPFPWRYWDIARDFVKKHRYYVGAAVLVSLCPYHYEPSGKFEVLPGDRADVRALVDGDVREVLVREGDMVKAGQVLVKLDDAGARAALAAAEAERARLQSELSAAKKGPKQEEIEVARQRVATARKTAEVARAQATRLQSAFSRKSVTAQEYDRARGTAEVAEQQLLEAQRALQLAASPVVIDHIKALEAGVEEAAAKVEFQKQALAYTQVAAPIAGRVVSAKLQLDFARGSYLKRGDPIAIIEDISRGVHAEIHISEVAIADVRIEGGASAKPWSYPGSNFEGKVLSIAPAAEEGDYGRIVRVLVLLQDPEGRLRSGLTGNAKVDGGWHPVIVVFTRALVRFFLVEIWSWVP